MTNAYVSLDMLKHPSALNISGADYDERLLGLAEAASSAIDRVCNRYFYARRATLRFDVEDGARLLVPDLIAVDPDGMRCDERGDGSFAAIWDAADYRLLPHSAAPASAGRNSAARPYTRIEAANGRRFPVGSGRAQVAGLWGWGEWLRLSDETLSAAIDADATELTLAGAASGLAKISPGNTLLIDGEQIYVRARSDASIAVARGVNGAPAASHADNVAIRIYEYPPPVTEAARIIAMRLWNGALADAAAQSEADIAMLIYAYRKPALGV